MLEPFLLSKSPEYRNQIALQRRAAKEGLQAVSRLLPMMPLREEKMLLTLSFMLCAAVGIAISVLGGFHVYLTCTAQTTIEFHANWSARKRARAAGQKWKNPYSHGSAKANWQQVYGTGNLLKGLLVPSRREPEFLPVPVPGHSSRRALTAAAAAAALKQKATSSSNSDGCKGDAATCSDGDENVIRCDAEPQDGLKAVSLI